MKYNHLAFRTGLIQQELTKIRKATWYRQRFDACPHFMFFLGDSHISSISKTKYPFGQRIAYAGFSKNRADWYHGLEELEYTASKIIEAARNNPNISSEMILDFKHWEEAFYAECLKIKSEALKPLSDKALLEAHDKLTDIYTKKLNSSPLIDGFALATDKIIAAKIRDVLRHIGKEDNFVEYFATLTAPTFLSFLQKEEIELLRISDEIKKDPKKRKALVSNHQSKFFWIQNNYVNDNVLSYEFFDKRVSELEKIDCRQKIKGTESIPNRNSESKLILMKYLNLSKEISTLLKITDDFNYWQDERKKGTFWATHYFSMLLKEISRRKGYTIEELKYAFPPEMASVFSGKVKREELQKRFEYCMILWVPNAYDVTTDKALIQELDAIGTGKSKQVSELKGFTASLGKTRGIVRILESVEEVRKVKEGDIIVAVMTRPDYLPAMKKASAFITDEGGITCHASIVAREMHKPCIIGTKNATKILHDGDEVEVDADEGIIKVLRRAVK